MRRLVDGPQAIAGEVRVDLGCREVGVTEQLLHDAHVGAALEQVCGVCVTKRVRMQLTAVAEWERGEDPTDVACPERATAAVEEHGVG
jgi:hypothetical protein